MPNDNRIEQFLNAATAGLRDDPELQLDVRAELAAHIQDKLDEAGAAGGAGAVDTALQAMGAPTDLAADMASANRGRMTRRAQVRTVLRFLLVPAAVLTAVLVATPYPAQVIASMERLGDGSGLANAAPGGGWLAAAVEALPSRLSAHDRLVVQGDRSRLTQAQQQRAIWEAYPQSRTFAGNYVTYLAMDIKDLGSTDAERLAKLTEELAKARETDPGNARYDYVLAGHKLKLAATIEEDETDEKGADGKTKMRSRLVVTDRRLLDEAMADFRRGVQQPFLRRYSSDMLRERLRILGEPTSQLEMVRQISLSAAVLLPDLATYRLLTKAAFLYADVLLKEGRRGEAEAYLQAWRPLCLQVTDDSFCLIDVLVAAAIAGVAESEADRVYRENGLPEQAAAAKAEASRIRAPIQEWKDRRKNPPPGYAEQEQTLKRSAGVLVGMLLPALGEWPSVADYTAGRWTEYVLAETVATAALVLLFVAAMFGAMFIALRWRLVRGTASAPILLVPDLREAGRVLLVGVLVPVLVYYVYSRWLPASRREFAMRYAWPMLLVQLLTLLSAVVYVTVGRSLALVRARCEALGVECSPMSSWRRGWRWLAYTAAAAAALGLLVAAVAPAGKGDLFCPQLLGLFAGLFCLLLLVFALRGVVRIWRALFAEDRLGLYYGSVARSLIPLFAAAAILLGLAARPYLHWQEVRLVRSDPLMSIDAERPAFTRVEMEVTDRLRNALRAAAREPAATNPAPAP